MAPRDIHSLPTETFSDIFLSAVAAVTPTFWQSSPTSLQTELERIANAPLLILSRVCSRWHEMALNNPTFWSNVEVHGVIGHRPSVLESTIGLLNARLERSRDAPLSISLRCNSNQPLHPRIFHLLAQHSPRWEKAQVIGSLRPGLDTSLLKGRLPRLNSLAILLTDGLETVELLGIAPHLEHLSLTAPLPSSKSLGEIIRSKQLRSFQCMVFFPEGFEDAASLLPAATDFGLTIALDIPRRYTSLKRMHIPSLIASISTLECIALKTFDPPCMSSVLNHLFASLTVPQLRRLTLGCSVYPQLVLEWPHTQFLVLCERSDLGRCLKTLHIAEVRIAQSDLLEILSVLEALEHLEVGDAPREAGKRSGKVGKRSGKGRKRDDSESALITDSFLQKMTCAPAKDCLVPHLSYFACVSRLAFTHTLLVDFITSRMARLSEASTLFHVCIHPFPESDASFISAVHTRLWELAAANNKFVYEAGEEGTPQIQ
ncbi:hypothetical protein B0H12DRAFT_1329552, partial [Mycena haematopus]